jgi:hypothetical protein
MIHTSPAGAAVCAQAGLSGLWGRFSPRSDGWRGRARCRASGTQPDQAVLVISSVACGDAAWVPRKRRGARQGCPPIDRHPPIEALAARPRAVFDQEEQQ